MAHEQQHEHEHEQYEQREHEHQREEAQEHVEKPGLNLFNVIESVILAMSVGLMLWVANLVVEHGKLLSSHDTMLKIDDARLDSLESRGSPTLSAHMSEDAAEMSALRLRLDKVEAALLILQSTPSELKAIAVRLESIKEAQTRMEKSLDEVARRP